MILRRLIAALARPAAALMHRCGLMRRQVYVRMDGGLASQMHFYLVGEYFRNRGFDVEYELDWYDYCGRDLTGNFARNFELLKFAPSLPFRRVSNQLKVSLYRLLYKHVNDYEASPASWQALKAPIYLDGYYPAGEGFYGDMRKVFVAEPVDVDAANSEMGRRISEAAEAVGMHVRRGDLAVDTYAYGAPASDDYFIKAIRLMQGRHGADIPFFIFSDEPQWVRTHLLPQFPKGCYEIVNLNGSDKGYLDLWLISQCRHFITSKGSFGRFGALLSPRRGDVVICDSAETRNWLSHIPSAIPLPQK